MGRVRAPSFEDDDDTHGLSTQPTLAYGHAPSLPTLDPSRQPELLHIKAVPQNDDEQGGALFAKHITATCERSAYQRAHASSSYGALTTQLTLKPSDELNDPKELARLLGSCHMKTTADLVRKDEMLRAKARADMAKASQARNMSFSSVEASVEEWKRKVQAEKEAKEKALAAERAAEAARQAKEDEAAAQAKAKAEEEAEAEANEEAAKAEADEKEAKASAEAKANEDDKTKAATEAAAARAKADAAQKASVPAAKEPHVLESEARLQRLRAVHAASEPILNSTDPRVKKIRMDVKKQIGEACNQVANTPKSIKLVVTKLCKVLSEARAAGPEYLNFSLDILATRLTSQVKVLTEIRSCFPLAHVAAMCSVHTPELADIFVAHLNQICPFTVPFCPPLRPEQSPQEFLATIGMEWDDERQAAEELEKYQMRMSMAIALLAATMQPPHTYTAMTILALLETAGFALLSQYKRQFQKLLELLQRHVLPDLSRDAKSGAAANLARLNTFLGENQVRNEPEGRVPKESEISKDDEEHESSNDSRGGYNNNNSNNRGNGGGRGRGRGRGYR
ncbi:hypothetical protein SPRG_12004 [Saprolegnia parasitica CBS 223.65]|uniref:mRNA export factor GLE1 n=1 Tax=Saprolegnia parasitica (strain CBS 223.65) TaxID=695850 RepID=A0A067C7S6_SAPPC|nr:hypothetical protein SPRG_12004 [Saprolegnia parasitica CBS 223.65]KDO22867.1 hypothetical protein SPRG_12004 [Saprolegnia parasitica CBS 223.65]|eukprot:XP_012206424.1 hypothetical protein SPRG_12004 [Saprolegnia parasitica CBS 223.65]